ncbi:MAG: sulfatase-like hydrolase/transferase [Candidatus Latescibacteria bacterium]|nr:sulfatase-like hydrolase/transferase [Candidatus Latescibacterota bacterium]
MSDSTRPNIILINCDDLGYGDLGCYGSQVNKTPALDRMAAEGLRLTDFYMASAVCSPSRGALLTGCYPARIGFGSFDGRWVLFPGQPLGLNPDEVTTARLLKEAGYATKIVGKWHCGDQPEFLPTRHGFDSYYGIPYSNDMGRQKEDDVYPPLPLLRDDEVIQAQPDQRGITERYVEESVRFMRAHKDQPFFLYLAHMHVHLPHYPPERFLRDSENGPYGAAVACIDWAADVLLHELKDLGLDEDTMVIFTSDNGSRVRDEGGSNGPLRGTKGTTWEGGQRVPCIVRWPGKIAAGSESNELTLSMDLHPTLAALAGVELPADREIDGVDLSPLLLGQAGAVSPHQAFFYYKRNSIEAVRSGPWKLHLRKDNEELRALYNLENDIGETTDLADQHPDIVQELLARVEECRRDLGDEAAGVEGAHTRPIGRVEQADTLTHFDPEHPYMIALYDLKDRG